METATLGAVTAGDALQITEDPVSNSSAKTTTSVFGCRHGELLSGVTVIQNSRFNIQKAIQEPSTFASVYRTASADKKSKIQGFNRGPSDVPLQASLCVPDAACPACPEPVEGSK